MESNRKPEPPIPYSPYMDAVRLLIRVMRRHHACVERRIGDLGIHHSQNRMLMHLAGCTQDISQKELAEAMGISPAAVATTLKRLEQEGFVTRTTQGDDSRCNAIRISDKGRAKVVESREVFETVDRLTFEGFSDEEIEAFITLMKRVDANLDAAGAPTEEPCRKPES